MVEIVVALIGFFAMTSVALIEKVRRDNKRDHNVVAMKLDMIAQGHANPSMRKLLGEITDEVKSGNPLSSALRKHPLYFDDLYCDLVYTGEQSGALETIYDRIATYKEKAEALKSKIKKVVYSINDYEQALMDMA